MRWLPGMDTLRHYDIAWLRSDVLAGLALTAVRVPVGIAHAVAAGVPAISGLYATIFGLLAYAIFGPSRVRVLGPDSSLVALILGALAGGGRGTCHQRRCDGCRHAGRPRQGPACGKHRSRFAELKDPVKDKLKRFGLLSSFGERRFFATLGEAAGRYVDAHDIAWVGWEDRQPAPRATKK